MYTFLCTLALHLLVCFDCDNIFQFNISEKPILKSFQSNNSSVKTIEGFSLPPFNLFPMIYNRDISLLHHQFLKLSSVLTFGRTWELRQGHRALCNKFLLYGPPSIPWTLGPRFQSTSQFGHPEFIFFTVKVKT